MGRSVVLLIVLTLLILSLVGPSVAAHDVNHLAADAQVSAEGKLVLESAYATQDGFVVLYQNWNGRSGEVVGVSEFSAARVDVTEVPATLTDRAWASVGKNTTITAVLYADSNGDDLFNPTADSPQVSFGRPTQVTFNVTRGEAPVYVSTASIGAQQSTGAVTIREIALAQAGHVVISLSENGEPTQTLGHVSLDAGTHRSVQVDLNRSFLADQNNTFTVFATAYTDSGDSVLDGDDKPVRANGSLVTTRFSVVPAENRNTNTPASEVNTATASPSPAESVDGTTTTTMTQTGEEGAGFGVALALIGVLVLGLGLNRLRRRRD
jgi:hypothetical protein